MPGIDTISFFNASSDAAAFQAGADSFQFGLEQLAALQREQGIDHTAVDLADTLSIVLDGYRHGRTSRRELQELLLQIIQHHPDALAKVMSFHQAGWKQQTPRFSATPFAWLYKIKTAPARAAQNLPAMQRAAPTSADTAPPIAPPASSNETVSNGAGRSHGTILFPAEFRPRDYVARSVDSSRGLFGKFLSGAIAVQRLLIMARVLPKLWPALGFERGSLSSLFEFTMRPLFDRPLMVPFVLEALLKNLADRKVKEAQPSLTLKEMFQWSAGRGNYFFDEEGEDRTITIAYRSEDYLAIARVRYDPKTGELRVDSGNNVELKVFAHDRAVVLEGKFLFTQ